MELSVELVLGFLGTIGSLIVLAREAVKALRARAEGDASATREALKLARKSREDTGQHITRWSDCEERCRALAEAVGEARSENRKLRERLDEMEQRGRDLEAENARFRERVEALEEQVRILKATAPLRRTLADGERLRKIP